MHHLTTTSHQNIDPAFGYWLAGFVDGEGCFLISRIKQSYRCIFTLALRRDDRPILDEIQKTLGLGDVHDFTYPRKAGSRHKYDNFSSRWDVMRKEEVIALRDVFNIFPLRAKKATDFSIWSRGVDEWMTHANKWDHVSWEPMAMLKKQLEDSRKFMLAETDDEPEGGN